MFKQTRGMLFAVVAALGLSACGGGSLGDGDDAGPGGPAKISLVASSLQLPSDANSTAAGITLTAIVKDADNVVVPDVTVTFSTPDSASLTVPSPAQTNSNGVIEANLSTGDDPSNRSITVTARVTTATGTISDSVVIQVSGTSLVISGPDATQINEPTPYTAVLTNAAGAGIPNTLISIDTTNGNDVTPTGPQGFVTNSAGLVSFDLTATQANSNIVASALGLTTTKAVRVSTDEFNFTSPVSTTPPQDAPEVNIRTLRTVTVRWLRSGAAVPNGTTVNFTSTRGLLSPASTTNPAVGCVAPFTGSISATIQGGVATVKLCSNESGPSLLSANGTLDPVSVSTTSRVEFVAVTPDQIDVQASPANIAASQTSEISAVVRDPNNNLVKNVTVDFSLSDNTAGSISAGSAVTNSQGVAKITYTASTQNSASKGVIVTGRVRGTAIADTADITVGGRAVDITIGIGSEITEPTSSSYALPFTVIVTDSSGNPVPSAQFTLSYVPLAFVKGPRPVPGEEPFLCPNEDLPPYNDVLDFGEDTNEDGDLQPGRIAALPSTVDLGPDGAGEFLLTYPQDRGDYVKVRVTGTATVAGTSSSESRELLLPIAEGDDEHLPVFSPYGEVLDCGPEPAP